MTHFKKSLALLLAFVMIFSTMSVAASAFDATVDGGFNLGFQIKFFRMERNADGLVIDKEGNVVGDENDEIASNVDVDNDINWIETTVAKPGEAVKARLYIGADFYTYTSNMGMVFDSQFLSTVLEDNVKSSLTTNSNYIGGSALFKVDSAMWYSDETKFSCNTNGSLVTRGFIPSDYFDTRNLISHELKFEKAMTLSNEDWIVEYDLLVNDNEHTNTAGNTGMAVIPKELAATTESGYPMLISFPKSEKGGEVGIDNKAAAMYYWDAVVKSEEGIIGTTSEVILNANSGYFDDEGVYLTEKNIQGIVGAQVTQLGSANPLKDGYVHSGWSEVPVPADWSFTPAILAALGKTQADADAQGGKLTEAQVEELMLSATELASYEYQHDEITLYAVWTSTQSSDNYYTYNVYYMDANGAYPSTPDFSQQIIAATGETATLIQTPVEGFTLDLENSDESITVKGDKSSVLNAYYERNKYTVTYSYVDNSGVEQTQEYEAYHGAALPEFDSEEFSGGVPNRKGYTFTGWADQDGRQAPAAMPLADVNLYAQFEKNTYTYMFDATDGGKFESNGERTVTFSYEYGATPEAFDEIPVFPGKEFVGWSENLPATVTEDKTFVADYSDLAYTVTFKDDANVIDELEVYYGDKVYADDVPEGYSAEDSWVDENSNVVVFPYTVTGNTVLTAVDSANVFDAEFYVDGNIYRVVPTVFGEQIVVPEDPELEGFEFLMWDPEVGTMEEHGMRFDAVFDAKETRISFVNTGDTEIDDIVGDYGTPVTVQVPNPERSGYIFTGWNISVPSTMPAEDLEIAATWTKNTYSIRFEDFDGSLIEVVTGLYESDVEAPELPNVAGYVYEWNTTVPSTMPAENITIKAVRTALKYSIEFDTNGGVPAEIAPIEDVDTGAEIIKPKDPTKDGFTFAGWAETSDPETVIVFPEKMPADGLSLIAVWTTNSHNAIFDAAGGIFADGTSTKIVPDIEYGDLVTAPADPERDGYIFDGWDPVPEIMLDKDMTFTATWIPDASGSVEYKINVVTINPADGSEITQTVIENYAKDGDTVAIVKAGEASTADNVYTFEQLITSASNVLDESRTTVTEMTVVSGEDNVLTVYCKLADVTVTFLANGGEFADGTDAAEVTGTYGSEITAPADPERAGYSFAGWDKDLENATFTSAETYVAKWEKETYNAEFYINGELYASVPYEYGAAISAPSYEAAEGSTFSGWNVPAGSVMGPGNMRFDATLTENEYTLSYSYSSAPAGAEIPASVSGLNFNDEVTLADATEIEGYTFNGWTYNNTLYDEGDKFTMPNGNAALVGSYTAIEYSIAYDTGDESVELPSSAVTSATVGEKFALPELVRDNYTFIGWETNGVYYPANAIFTMPAEDVDFAANWVENPGKNTVTYSWDGNIPDSAVLPSALTNVLETTPVTVAPVPSVEGYTFDGWYYNGVLTQSFVMPDEAVTLTGTWTKDDVPPAKYELSLDAAGGTFADSSTVYTAEFEEGQTVVTPGEPSRSGYKFTGWTDTNGNAASIPATMPANAVELTASWSELIDITFTVDGEPYDTATDAGVEGDPLPVPSKGEPEKDGYTFAGWVDDEGNPVTTIPAEDVTVNAKWVEDEPEEYSLKYYDGTTLLKTEYYAAGETITYFTPDAKPGHTFKGWINTPEDDVMPEGDHEVFADWDVIKYSITLDANDGEFTDGTSLFTEDVPFGAELSDVVPAQPTRDGYEFIGWEDENGNDATIPATMPEEDISLSAKWEIKEITVTFDANGGEFDGGETTKDVTGNYGADLNAPADPERDGFIFKGWNGMPADGKIPAEDITVEAIWEAEVVTYTLTIDAAGGTVEGQAKIVKELAAGEAIASVADPVREGYTFKGWDKVIPATMPAEDYTVTATWEADETPTHTITYYLAKDGAVFATGTYEEGEAMTHPTPVAEGIVFAEGWVDADGNPIPDTMGDKDIVAYAQIDHLVSYKATFVVDGSTYDEFDVEYGAEIPTPTTEPTKEGYLFAGWKDSNGHGVAATMPAKDVTYTAQWEAVPTDPDKYVAKFIADGETIGIEILEEGDAIPVPEVPAKFGYVFVGWDPEVPATMPAKNMEFVAQWEIDKTFVAVVVGGTVVSGAVIGTAIGVNAAIITGVAIVGGIIAITGVAQLIKHTHTVTYMVDGEVYKTYKVVEGTKIPVPSDPAKEGSEFAGWTPEIPEKMGNSDLVFEATWASDTDVVIPDTGSAAGIAAFAAISGAAAAAYVIASRKKKDEE